MLHTMYAYTHLKQSEINSIFVVAAKNDLLSVVIIHSDMIGSHGTVAPLVGV